MMVAKRVGAPFGEVGVLEGGPDARLGVGGATPTLRPPAGTTEPAALPSPCSPRPSHPSAGLRHAGPRPWGRPSVRITPRRGIIFNLVSSLCTYTSSGPDATAAAARGRASEGGRRGRVRRTAAAAPARPLRPPPRAGAPWRGNRSSLHTGFTTGVRCAAPRAGDPSAGTATLARPAGRPAVANAADPNAGELPRPSGPAAPAPPPRPPSPPSREPAGALTAPPSPLTLHRGNPTTRRGSPPREEKGMEEEEGRGAGAGPAAGGRARRYKSGGGGGTSARRARFRAPAVSA